MPWEEEVGDVCTVSVLIGTRGGSDVVEDAEWSTVYCCWEKKKHPFSKDLSRLFFFSSSFLLGHQLKGTYSLSNSTRADLSAEWHETLRAPAEKY